MFEILVYYPLVLMHICWMNWVAQCALAMTHMGMMNTAGGQKHSV